MQKEFAGAKQGRKETVPYRLLFNRSAIYKEPIDLMGHRDRLTGRRRRGLNPVREGILGC